MWATTTATTVTAIDNNTPRSDNNEAIVVAHDDIVRQRCTLDEFFFVHEVLGVAPFGLTLLVSFEHAKYAACFDVPLYRPGDKLVLTLLLVKSPYAKVCTDVCHWDAVEHLELLYEDVYSTQKSTEAIHAALRRGRVDMTHLVRTHFWARWRVANVLGVVSALSGSAAVADDSAELPLSWYATAGLSDYLLTLQEHSTGGTLASCLPALVTEVLKRGSDVATRVSGVLELAATIIVQLVVQLQQMRSVLREFQHGDLHLCNVLLSGPLSSGAQMLCYELPHGRHVQPLAVTPKLYCRVLPSLGVVKLVGFGGFSSGVYPVGGQPFVSPLRHYSTCVVPDHVRLFDVLQAVIEEAVQQDEALYGVLRSHFVVQNFKTLMTIEAVDASYANLYYEMLVRLFLFIYLPVRGDRGVAPERVQHVVVPFNATIDGECTPIPSSPSAAMTTPTQATAAVVRCCAEKHLSAQQNIVAAACAK